MHVHILGAGSWGVALGCVLAKNGHTVHMWTRSLAERDQLNAGRSRHFPGMHLPRGIKAFTDLTEIASASVVIVAVPAQHVRSVLQNCRFNKLPFFLLASKGIDVAHSQLMSEVLIDVHNCSRFGVISGPNFAQEVVQGSPSATTVAVSHEEDAVLVRAALHHKEFRVYTSCDTHGVQVGGALKNVYALACGMLSGLNFGHNARAALITRALAELVRLGTAMGGQEETFYGLSGLGDLLLTCGSDLSRNFRFGEAFAKGDMFTGTVEGVHTAQCVPFLRKTFKADIPIAEHVYAVIHGGMKIGEAIESILDRSPKWEHYKDANIEEQAS